MVPQQQSLLASLGTAAASATAERKLPAQVGPAAAGACSASVSVSVVWPQLIARDLFGSSVLLTLNTPNSLGAAVWRQKGFRGCPWSGL